MLYNLQMGRQPPDKKPQFSIISFFRYCITDAVLASLLLVLPNLILISHRYHHTQEPDHLWWLCANVVFLGTLLLLRHMLVAPLCRMALEARRSLHILNSEQRTPLSLRQAAHATIQLARFAQELHARHHDTQQALVETQATLRQISTHLTTAFDSTSREMLNQYQSVLAYANYLEDHITRHKLTPDLRYDFDDISESAFTLKLIAGALQLVQQPAVNQPTQFDAALLMQQTLLALSASLDRRTMKLTTSEVDETVEAYACPATTSHALWMVLLGTIRYAAPESTLRLRCLYNRTRTQVLLSIVISELSPGRLSESERSAFLSKQAEHLSPHLFADTIRIHANIQLAVLLVQPLGGDISVLALTSHSCEICLWLPAHPT